ncbi:anthranilate synthase component II [Gallibacterium salpingitidis]|uniref:Anthranilate synthase component II n=1 Tax=Gallibacterium salpingitidis TaxID=505341 RepID=A0A1A7NNY4_9PAST|nr:anthranilate synthase component II [Gallibacterium salpingitidis]OBW91872.1 anthranilate synthase component II [Gallibacterium salpingitidis]
MLLLIDNHDSFTYNLVDLLRKIIPPSKFTVIQHDEIPVTELDRYSHILLSPGPDIPSAYPQLFQLLQQYHQNKVILGVCLGHQTLCQFFGASLYNLPEVRHGRNITLRQTVSSPLWKNVPNNSQIGVYHSWAVEKTNFPDALEIIAECEQGVIMAIQHRQLPIYGVQFHPESFMTEYGETILRNWLAIRR